MVGKSRMSNDIGRACLSVQKGAPAAYVVGGSMGSLSGTRVVRAPARSTFEVRTDSATDSWKHTKQASSRNPKGQSARFERRWALVCLQGVLSNRKCAPAVVSRNKSCRSLAARG